MGKGGGGDSSSDVSSFDGEIVIEKSKKSLLTLPSSSKSIGKVKEKSNKEKASNKLDKSKAIKKEKRAKRMEARIKGRALKSSGQGGQFHPSKVTKKRGKEKGANPLISPGVPHTSYPSLSFVRKNRGRRCS